ncbi:MAG TPA: phosphate butyryltransferase [Cyanobacteria bacterium UBA8530]|nr:phosphate butyryltransferase [Cyanobacteria bacterium UBA8530]
MIKQLDQLLDLAKTGQPQRIALAAAADDDALSALDRAVGLGIAEGILVGDPSEIGKIAQKIGIDLKKYTVCPAENDSRAALEAVGLVSSGKADLVMKGRLSTSILLKAVLDKRVGLRTEHTLSHVAIAELKGTERLLFITDAAMNIEPTLAQRASIIRNAATIARCLGIEKPRVALLTASDKILEKDLRTSEAAVLSKEGERGQLGEIFIDGPMTLASALSPEAASLNGLKGEVAGQADVLMVSHIEAGNVLYKGMVYFAGALVAGILAGAKAPVILTSRADSDESKLYSIALGAAVASKSCAKR